MALGAARALRGTRTLTRAFFDAAESIPVDRRPAVVKAALVSIRDELKAIRDKAKLAKAKDAATVIKKAPSRRTVSKS